MAEQKKATDPQHTAGGLENAAEGVKGIQGVQKNTTCPTPSPQEISNESAEQAQKNAETLGPTTHKTTDDSAPEDTGICGDSVLAEKSMAPPSEGPSCPGEDNKLNVEKNSTCSQVVDGSHGDNNRETPTNKKPKEKVGDDLSREEKANAALTLSGTKEDEVDGPITRLDEVPTGIRDTDIEAREGGLENAAEGVKGIQSVQKNITCPTPLPQEISNESAEQAEKNAETLGPTTHKTTEQSVPEGTGICGDSHSAEERMAPSRGGSSRTGSGIIVAVCIAGLAVLVLHLLQPEFPPQKNLQQIDIFLKQMEKVKSQFPNQRPELWKRSRIHLERHLNTTQPTEPVSLILTAGLRAERTMHCLAQGLASTFSSALNASVLHIDGASKASQDSDQVKLDIDSQLQGAFEGDKPVAVIHRFEELPPGSTLIFYRYCDHENAAYKKTFLIFTVLLGEEEEIPAKIRLSSVEEMVDDHLQKKFISHDGNPVAFDRMDLDKYGGLWSRISHLILPVAAEKRIEHEGC